MATSGWRTNSTLKTFVFEQYGRFNVFQLVRLLQWKRGNANRQPSPPDSREMGQRFRFRAELSPAFPGREISRLSISRPRQPKRADMQRRTVQAPEVIEIRTPNYCVASELGPLPEPFTDWVRDQERGREYAMSHFLDMFNQRLNLLRFQMKIQQTLALNNLPPADTPHALYLASLMGLGQSDLSAQVPLPPRAWLGLAGLLSNCRRSGSTITHVLSLFLGARVTTRELVGAWQRIESGDRIALGRRNHRLGQQSLLGRRVWDQQARVRLEVAPLDYERFCSLLPPNLIERAAGSSAPYFDGFLALLRLLLDRLYDCEILMRVHAGTVPSAVLTARPDKEANSYRGLRLGQTAWLNDAGGNAAAPEVRTVTYLVRAYGGMEAA